MLTTVQDFPSLYLRVSFLLQIEHWLIIICASLMATIAFCVSLVEIE